MVFWRECYIPCISQANFGCFFSCSPTGSFAGSFAEEEDHSVRITKAASFVCCICPVVTQTNQQQQHVATYAYMIFIILFITSHTPLEATRPDEAFNAVLCVFAATRLDEAANTYIYPAILIVEPKFDVNLAKLVLFDRSTAPGQRYRH